MSTAQSTGPDPDAATLAQWNAEFEAALNRPAATRLKYAFIHTHKPGLDDGPGFRSFDSTREYRQWCNQHLPEWLGYRSDD